LKIIFLNNLAIEIERVYYITSSKRELGFEPLLRRIAWLDAILALMSPNKRILLSFFIL